MSPGGSLTKSGTVLEHKEKAGKHGEGGHTWSDLSQDGDRMCGSGEARCAMPSKRRIKSDASSSSNQKGAKRERGIKGGERGVERSNGLKRGFQQNVKR